MATSKTLTPTNVTIQIPEFTDQPDQRVNSNCIDKEADAINSLNTAIGNIDPKRGDLNTISSDTTIIGLDAGTYQVVLSSGTPVTNGYIPAQYGTLIVNDSGKNYKSYMFVTTGNAVYSRICHKGNSTWYTAWQELVRKNDFTPSSFTTPTNLGSGVSVDKGGYVQVGNMVVVNCRLNLGSAIQSNIAKFPASGLTSTHVSVTNNKGIDMGIDQNGYLNAGASVSTGTLVISTTYFCMS